jgi:hypothetical protein
VLAVLVEVESAELLGIDQTHKAEDFKLDMQQQVLQTLEAVEAVLKAKFQQVLVAVLVLVVQE